MNISPTVLPIRTKSWVTQRVDDSFCVNSLINDDHHTLNGTAYFLWERCDGRTTLASTISELTDIYPDNKDEVSASVFEQANVLYMAGLVTFNSFNDERLLLLKTALVNLNPPSQAQVQSQYVLQVLAYKYTIVLVNPDESPQLILHQGQLPESISGDDTVVIELCSIEAQRQGREPDLRLLYTNSKEALSTTPTLLENELLIDQTSTNFAAALLHKLAPKTVDEVKIEKPFLSIAMATYEDYDGVFFTIENIIMNHPEVADQVEFVVLDNNPAGVSSEALKRLADSIRNVRYIPNSTINGTAVRSVLFDLARGDYVLCLDCHVLVAPGSIKHLIEYYKAHPDSVDLIQGPMLTDDQQRVVTQMEPVWQKGMFGVWATDERYSDDSLEPFEIPMHGLGLFSCRKAAWPGFNPLFYGFGGEEGYIHQKFRNLGGKTLCLPALKWLHRFARPNGPPYTIAWEDRIRNYFIGFDEVGFDTSAIGQHFNSFLKPEVVLSVKAMMALERNNPFDLIDQIFFVVPDGSDSTWSQAQEDFKALGLRFKVKRIDLKHGQSIASAHREILAMMREQNAKRVLILEQGFVFTQGIDDCLREAILELRKMPWNVLCLDLEPHRAMSRSVDGTNRIFSIVGPSESKAKLYDRSAFSLVENLVPASMSDAHLWEQQHENFTNALSRTLTHFCLNPVLKETQESP